jgi:uracil-DNA glycosylase
MSWKNIFKEESGKDYYKHIIKTVQEDAKNNNVYPPHSDIFNAFTLTPLDKIKVVILGQDPYHGPGQAHGLSFSVNEGTKTPPSLKNIFKEIKSDLNIDNSKTNLEPWAKQGVFLLNSFLTVVEGKPMSHSKIGWHIFTAQIIAHIGLQERPIVFLLWGAASRDQKKFVHKNHHLILEAAHPSPLSAHNGFFGCKHFSKANEFLIKNNIDPINWST